MDKESVRVAAVETAYKGYFQIDKYRMSIRQFDGSWMLEFSREVFLSGPAVVVILYDPHRDALVLVEQFRIAPYVVGRPCWMLEFVAGKIAAGEDADEVARRETMEEAGCDILRLERICEYFVSPGTVDESITMYIGQIDSTKSGGIFGLADEHENICVHVMPADDVIALADAGKLPNLNTYAGTLWFARHRADLKKRWLGA